MFYAQRLHLAPPYRLQIACHQTGRHITTRLQQHTTGTTGHRTTQPDSKLAHAQCKPTFITSDKWTHHHAPAATHHRNNRVLRNFA
jgi:hypothetical protein